LTLKFVKKLADNMNGYYPAICRVLLSTVGPYQQNALQPNMTAFNVLRNVMYRELKKLPSLAAAKPDKVSDYLPDNVSYDAQTTSLTHTYFGGEQRTTDLSALQIVEVDLLDKQYHRALTNGERTAAERTIH
jgi:hypothetical protein